MIERQERRKDRNGRERKRVRGREKKPSSEALPERTFPSMALRFFTGLRFREKNVCPKLTSRKVVELGFPIGHFVSESMLIVCYHSTPLG